MEKTISGQGSMYAGLQKISCDFCGYPPTLNDAWSGKLKRLVKVNVATSLICESCFSQNSVALQSRIDRGTYRIVEL